MRQLVGHGDQTVRDLMVSLAPQRLQDAAARLARAERAAADEPMRYATALAEWGDAGGYDAEVFWDTCCTKALGESFAELARRPLRTFSGGEQKRLALEAILRSEFDVLLLDEPDNFLDVPGKRWLEDELRASRKTMLYVSHDRELLAATATKIVTVEASGAWTHGGRFADYHDARQAHLEHREHTLSLYEDERKKLEELVAEMRRRAKISDTFAPRLKAAESRLRQFLEKNEKPERSASRRSTCASAGRARASGRWPCEQLELHGLTDPFDAEIWYGERVAVLGGNGAGKSHFLRLLAGDTSVSHGGDVRLGAGVVPGHFNQTHEHPDWAGRTLLQILYGNDVVRGPAMGMLRRYELQGCADQIFETLSGGQQARFQILLLELTGATLLLLDEPTDNLDLVVGRGARGGPGRVPGHGDRRHPRPLVPARLRPLRGVQRRLLGHRPSRPPRRLALNRPGGPLIQASPKPMSPAHGGVQAYGGVHGPRPQYTHRSLAASAQLSIDFLTSRRSIPGGRARRSARTSPPARSAGTCSASRPCRRLRLTWCSGSHPRARRCTPPTAASPRRRRRWRTRRR